MISLKTARELERMRKATTISAQALRLAGERLEAGMSTYELDMIIREFILSQGAKPSFLGYGGFPGSACISLNDEVIHGIPSKKRIIQNGDIVKVDVGAYVDGYHGDNAATYAVGDVSLEARQLMDVTEQSLYEGIKMARVGNRLGDVSHAIESYVTSRGYAVVKQFVGHGVGHELHESPEVPNYGPAGP